jgi:hypothetical protein
MEEIDQQGAAIVALSEKIDEYDMAVAAVVILPNGIQITTWEEVENDSKVSGR